MARAAGLLHDIGKLLLAVNFPERYARAWKASQRGELPLRSAETIEFGASHDRVGGVLLALWGLPMPLVDAVAFHHDPAFGGHARRAPVGLVHLADLLARPGRESTIPPELDTDYLAAAGYAVDEPLWHRLRAEAGC